MVIHLQTKPRLYKTCLSLFVIEMTAFPMKSSSLDFQKSDDIDKQTVIPKLNVLLWQIDLRNTLSSYRAQPNSTAGHICP